jgi:hypothetical protein
LWKEKYDTVVKGHVWMDLEIEIAPEEIIPFLLAVPRSSRGLFYFWAVIKYKQLAHNGLGWQSANLGQLDVYISKFLDSFPTGEKGLPVLPHLKAGHHDLHLLV